MNEASKSGDTKSVERGYYRHAGAKRSSPHKILPLLLLPYFPYGVESFTAVTNLTAGKINLVE